MQCRLLIKAIKTVCLENLRYITSLSGFVFGQISLNSLIMCNENECDTIWIVLLLILHNCNHDNTGSYPL